MCGRLGGMGSVGNPYGIILPPDEESLEQYQGKLFRGELHSFARYVPPGEELRQDLEATLFGIDHAKGPDMTSITTFSNGTATRTQPVGQGLKLDDLLDMMERARRQIDEVCCIPAHILTDTSTSSTAQEMRMGSENASERLRDVLGLLRQNVMRPALQVLVNDLCTTEVPNRVHKHRRNQTLAYHRRVQKKWAKRWRTHMVPAAYEVDFSVLDFPGMPSRGRALVLHPELAKSVKALKC